MPADDIQTKTVLPGINMLTQNILFTVLAAGFGWLVFLVLRSILSPLRSVPGPTTARFTNLWYLNKVRQGHFDLVAWQLRKKHGPVFRVGPNFFIVDSPEVIKPAYGVGTKFNKGQWYMGWQHPEEGRFTLFTDLNKQRHADNRKQFQSMYSMSSMVHYEAYVDECTKIFTNKLTAFAKKQEAINIHTWFQYYAFDVIGDITYSRRFGFMEKGGDVNHLIANIKELAKYSSVSGYYPRLHALLTYFSTYIKASGGAAALAYLTNFVQQQAADRQAQNQDLEKIGSKNDNAPQDFLDKLLVLNAKDPQRVTPYHVGMVSIGNIVAGSDTTALTLASILFHLIKYPHTLQKLRDEITRCESEGRCSLPNITFKETQEMPYLQAIMKEAMRVKPVGGLPFWREVPAGGAEFAGQFFPAGTNIGIVQQLSHLDEEVYGSDCKEFRPERWLDAEKEGGERIKQMENSYLPVCVSLTLGCL